MRSAPGDCLMIGNDVAEDLVAGNLGIKTFLVEDWLLNPKNLPIEADYRGSFADLVDYLMPEAGSKKSVNKPETEVGQL